MRAADALLLATLEYNNAILGVLRMPSPGRRTPRKPRPGNGKPAAVMGASIGTLSTAGAPYHVRPIFGFLDMHAPNRPEVMISHAAQSLEAQGHLTDTTTQS